MQHILLPILALGAYLIGSIPFGLLISRLIGGQDPRLAGSGNIGATNVTRLSGKGAGITTLLMDIGKGFLAVILVDFILPPNSDARLIAAFCALLGHMFPIWLLFRGGKGVAVFLGFNLALNIYLGITLCLVWLVTALVFRYSSLAALVAVITGPILFLYSGEPLSTIMQLAAAILIFFAHRQNIRRLWCGEEPKIVLSSR